MKRFVKVIVTAVITLTIAVFALTACNDGGEGGGTAPVGDNVFREGMTYAELMQVIDEIDNFTFIETAPGNEYNGYTPWQLTEKFDGRTLVYEVENEVFEGSLLRQYIFYEETTEPVWGIGDIMTFVAEYNIYGENYDPNSDNYTPTADGEIVWHTLEKTIPLDDKYESEDIKNVFRDYISADENGYPVISSADHGVSIELDGTTLRVNLEEGYTLAITNVNATDCTIPQEIHALKDQCVWIWQ